MFRRFTRLTAVLVAAALACGACSQGPAAGVGASLAAAPDSSFVGARLPDFALTERSGREVRRADLAGQPFVLDFIFTTCSGPCPLISARMRELQDRLAGTAARLVTITVDPETDTPAVLASYAEGLGADPERWWFLTGPEAEIDGLLGAIALARAKDAGAPLGMQVSHSTRLIAVDGSGAVRGYYDGQEDQGVRAALERVKWLAEHAGR